MPSSTRHFAVPAKPRSSATWCGLIALATSVNLCVWAEKSTPRRAYLPVAGPAPLRFEVAKAAPPRYVFSPLPVAPNPPAPASLALPEGATGLAVSPGNQISSDAVLTAGTSNPPGQNGDPSTVGGAAPPDAVVIEAGSPPVAPGSPTFDPFAPSPGLGMAPGPYSSPLVTPQMLVPFFRPVGSNGAFAGVIAPLFVPPLPPPSNIRSSATYEVK